MANQVEIGNKALNLIGMKRITSFDDDTPQARALNVSYDISLDSVLSAGLFSFSIERITYALQSDDLEFEEDGMSYLYQHPTESLRVVDFYPNNVRTKVERAGIYSDQEALKGRVVWKVRDTSLFFPAFVEAFAMKLAADMAYNLSNDDKRASDLMQLYESIYLPRAKSADSTQGDTPIIQADEWLLAKYGGSSIV